MKPSLLLFALDMVIAATVIAFARSTTRAKGARADRRALADYRTVVEEVYQIALEARSLDNTADLIEAKLRTFRTAQIRKESRS
ncbi:hypothetical protein [Planomonospora sp. ID82291]|uniref:hypothetical protein n=1 Tax=Planomonospora sp. ID82291 TaxID=2738136 RepID=UPI0018C44750|nr:hypothetical protein [Planomonospora sp. ID82291]MBG0818262.1 hypothetical protein [Planomonospora sp. ID82291]